MSERHQGARVIVIDTKANNPNAHIALSIVAALRVDARVAEVKVCGYRDVVAEAQSGCDLLLALDGEAAQHEILRRAAALAPRSALWSWEDPYETRAIQALAPLFDHVFTNDRASTAAYDAATFLPLAASSLFDLRQVRADEDCQYDVAFVGSPWPSRVRFLRALMRRRPDLKWKVALSRNPHVPNGYLEAPEFDYQSSPSHFDFIEIANRARVVISIHRDFAGSGRNVAAANPGPRAFEVALAGGYQIVDRREANIESFFEPSEIETFASIDECLAKIDEALGDPQARLARVRAAQARTRTDHLYENRTTLLLDEMLKREPRTHSRARPRPRLLFVTHNITSAGSFGGVEVYQDLIAAKLRERYDVLFYHHERPSGPRERRVFILANDLGRPVDIKTAPEFDSRYTLWSTDVDRAFASVLIDHEIDIVHFHHLIEHTVSLPIVAAALGVPSLYTLQDFYLACHRYNLLDHRGRFCSIDQRPRSETCAVCLTEAEQKEPGSQDYRRAFLQIVLQSIDVLMTNTEEPLRILRSVYPEATRSLEIHTLGLPLPRAATRAPAGREREAPGPLRVAFLGNFSSNKGADLFLSVARQLTREDVVFTVFGRVDPPFDARIAAQPLPNVEIRGVYAPGELDLSGQDVSLHLSNWPETYCITLSEAWSAGVVPVVTDIGALGERVEHDVTGFKVPVDGTGELLSLLLMLIHDRERVARVRAAIRPELWIDVAQHVSALMPIYEALLERRPAAPRAKARSPAAADIDMELLGVALGSPRWDQPGLVRNAELPSPALLQDQAPVSAAILKTTLLNLAEGRARTAVRSQVRFAQFGPYFSFNGARFGAFYPRLKDPLRISGHCWGAMSENLGERVIALRAVDDVILRRMHEVRTPASAHGEAGYDLRFVSEGLALELLEPRPYSVEIAALGTRTTEYLPLGFTIFGGEHPVLVSDHGSSDDHMVVVTAMESPAPPDAPVGDQCRVESVELLEDASSPGVRLAVQVVSQTAASMPDDALILWLQGPSCYTATFLAARHATSYATALGGAGRMTCAVWITGLPEGRYVLSIRRRKDPASARQPLNRQIEVRDGASAALLCL